MVLKILSKKLLPAASGSKIIVAAALSAVVILSVAGLSQGRVLEINNKTLDNFKFFLATLKNTINFAVTDAQIRGLFNLTLRGASAGADVSYGWLVLSAMNEFDLIDMVSSQAYRQKARDYFNSILDSRLDLVGRGQETGFDLVTIAIRFLGQGEVAASPMTILSLNSFAITDDTLAIFSSLSVLRQEKLYDGLWRYFDTRRGGDNHATAWEDAQAEIGFAIVKNPLRLGRKEINEDTNRLALKFATLWNTWGEYTNAFGVKPEFKARFGREISSIIQGGINSPQFAQVKPKSWLDKTKDKAQAALDAAAKTLAEIQNAVGSLKRGFNFKLAGSSLLEVLPGTEVVVENSSSPEPGPSTSSGSATPSTTLRASATPENSAAPVKNLVLDEETLTAPTPSISSGPSAPSDSPSAFPGNASPLASPSPSTTLRTSPSASPSPSLSASPMPSGSPTPSTSSGSPTPSASVSPSLNPTPSPSRTPSPTPAPATGSQPDILPPTVYQLKIQASLGAALITWQTDEDAITQFDYGPTANYGSTMADANFIQGHTIFLDNLSPQTAYHFRVRSQDKQNNRGAGPDQTFTTLAAVLISEVQAGPDEFIELYNPNSSAINLSGYYLNYYSLNSTWAHPEIGRWQLPVSATIPASGYYLVGIYNFPESSGNPNADWQTKTASNVAYGSGQLSASNGAIGLFPFKLSSLTDDQAQKLRLDAVGWGNVAVKEGSAAAAASNNKSLARTGLLADTNNNSSDFQVQNNPSPTNSLAQKKIELTPSPSVSPTPSSSPSPSPSSSASPSASPTPSGSPTPSPSVSPSPSASPSPSNNPSPSPSPSSSPSASPSPSPSPSSSPSPSPSPSPSASSSPSPSISPSGAPTPSPSASPAPTSVISDTFESYAVDSILDGQGQWISTAGNSSRNAQVSTDQAHSGTQSARVWGITSRERLWADFATASNGVLDFWVYVNRLDAYSNQSFYFKKDDVGIFEVWLAAGDDTNPPTPNLCAGGNYSGSTCLPLSLNTWRHVRIQWNASQYRYSADGGTNWSSWQDPAIGSLANGVNQLRSYGNGVYRKLYFDDFGQ